VADARRVLAQHQSLLALDRGGSQWQLVLLDVTTGRNIVVTRPFPGDWGMSASFSPDGRKLAIGLKESPPVRNPSEALATFGEPQWTRMVLVDCATGEVTLIEGRFDNSAWTPVWSHDSAWLVFDAPFDKSLFACHVHDPSPSLIQILRRRGRPAPLVDITDIAGPD
jgi:Tol biopolymer transport system component